MDNVKVTHPYVSLHLKINLKIEECCKMHHLMMDVVPIFLINVTMDLVEN